MVRRTIRVMSLVGMLLLAACASNGPVIQSPDVRLDSVQATALSVNRQTFVLSFDASNPNPFPLPVSRVRYNILLEQQSFAAGETVTGFTLPANGDGTFSITVDLDLMKSATRLMSIVGAGVARPIAYELHGSLEVALPFSRPVTFRNDGTIHLRGTGT